jgi:hypothetical protein
MQAGDGRDGSIAVENALLANARRTLAPTFAMILSLLNKLMFFGTIYLLYQAYNTAGGGVTEILGDLPKIIVWILFALAAAALLFVALLWYCPAQSASSRANALTPASALSSSSGRESSLQQTYPPSHRHPPLHCLPSPAPAPSPPSFSSATAHQRRRCGTTAPLCSPHRAGLVRRSARRCCGCVGRSL